MIAALRIALRVRIVAVEWAKRFFHAVAKPLGLRLPDQQQADNEDGAPAEASA